MSWTRTDDKMPEAGMSVRLKGLSTDAGDPIRNVMGYVFLRGESCLLTVRLAFTIGGQDWMPLERFSHWKKV